jgi:hypothetical protein
MSMRSLVVPVLGLIAVAVAGPAVALEASGKAIAVLRNAAASGPGGDRALETQGAVYAGDVIKTDRRGTAQILFADNTKMVVGPNAQVTVDRFIYQGSSQASTFAINAVRGSFRFITGVSAKNVYSIDTPTATIGVRGTAFDGHVAEDGTTTVAMWHGSVRICDKEQQRHCTVLSGASASSRSIPPPASTGSGTSTGAPTSSRDGCPLPSARPGWSKGSACPRAAARCMTSVRRCAATASPTGICRRRRLGSRRRCRTRRPVCPRCLFPRQRRPVRRRRPRPPRAAAMVEGRSIDGQATWVQTAPGRRQ